MKTHHFVAACVPGGSVLIWVCFGADGDEDECVVTADAPTSAAVAAVAADVETDSPSDCFFNDSLIERRNSSISTFGRTNCFGAGGPGGVAGGALSYP